MGHQAKKTESHQNLLYITPNDKYSLQQAVSSAITTVTLSEDKSQLDITSIAFEVLQTSSLFVLDVLLPYPLTRTIERIIERIHRKKKTNGGDQEKQNEDTQSDINQILNSLKLEDWSSFVAQIPYTSIPEDFDFPPGHPLPGKLYRSHPLKSKINNYIPIEAFDYLLYAEREAELLRLLVDLGATKIIIKEKQVGQLESELSANAKITSAGGLEGKIEGNINRSNESTRTFSLGGKKWKPELLEKFDGNNYSWLTYEPAWTAVVHARLHGKCLTASIELTNDDSYSISGKIGLAEGLLQNLAGLDASMKLNRSQTKTSLIAIEFAPPIND